jgi:hypothetical protein
MLSIRILWVFLPAGKVFTVRAGNFLPVGNEPASLAACDNMTMPVHHPNEEVIKHP